MRASCLSLCARDTSTGLNENSVLPRPTLVCAARQLRPTRTFSTFDNPQKEGRRSAGDSSQPYGKRCGAVQEASSPVDRFAPNFASLRPESQADAGGDAEEQQHIASSVCTLDQSSIPKPAGQNVVQRRGDHLGQTAGAERRANRTGDRQDSRRASAYPTGCSGCQAESRGEQMVG